MYCKTEIVNFTDNNKFPRKSIDLFPVGKSVAVVKLSLYLKRVRVSLVLRFITQMARIAGNFLCRLINLTYYIRYVQFRYFSKKINLSKSIVIFMTA